MSGVFSNFECKKDPDIQSFLINRAILYERKNKSRTYLLVDAADIRNLLGYCSVSPQVLRIPENLSNSQIKKLDGLYTRNRNGNGPISEIPAYLIGQVGKNSKFVDEITGKDILNIAFEAIETAQEAVGGRVAYIECKPIQEVIDFYKNNGFTYLWEDPIDGMLQMYTVI